jgi:DNA-binding transcriptional ArsR family regulator/uncharacterized protein YndB with AHSA1/START domain
MGRAGAPRKVASDPLQELIDALSSPIRREILWRLWQGELTAGEIAAAFDVTAGTISTHLAALRRAGLVVMRPEGNFRRYRVDHRAMETVVPLLGSSNDKWNVADDIPEQALATASTQVWVTVATEVGMDRELAFAAFLDEARYSEWLGVPVSIRDGRFATELEWGTKVRGHYEVVAPPQLIAMRWDFDDDAVPVPGRQLVGYLRFDPTSEGCRVEVHQAAADAEQGGFLAVAWELVLGRLKQHTELTTTRPRRRRPKHL